MKRKSTNLLILSLLVTTSLILASCSPAATPVAEAPGTNR